MEALRLADLIAERGTTVEAAAAALGVRPLLLRRIDAGEQPMPSALSVRAAAVLGVERWRVDAACQLLTDLCVDQVIYNPIPPRLGEPVDGAALVAATLDVFAPGIASHDGHVIVDGSNHVQLVGSFVEVG